MYLLFFFSSVYNNSMRKFEVTGMTCSACSARVEKAVSCVEGVKKAEVNLLTRTLTVQGEVPDEVIINAVVGAGYGARIYTGRVTEEQKGLSPKTRLIWSVVLLVPLFFIAMGPMVGIPLDFLTDIPLLYAGIQLVLTIPILILNYTYFTTGFRALFKRSPNMNTLIALGSGVAFLYGLFAFCMMIYGTAKGETMMVHEYMHNMYFESAGMILTLITVGKYLENRSKGRTTQAIESLLRLAPDTATVIRNGVEQSLPLEEVTVGDVVLVKTGERVPLDGIITEGRAAVDTSTITGESVPRDVKEGDEALSGTLVTGGYMKFEVTAAGEDTVLKKIVRLVEEASSSKAPISRLADKISGVFVPVVMSISLVAFIVWLAVGSGFTFALNVAISVLVISCPCALGLATPVAIMVGTGKGAEKGILIKSAESLELLHKVNCVVLDKTGTITEGKMQVAEARGDESLWRIAASLEKLSTHPLSAAVLAASEERGVALSEVADFDEVGGRGLKGTIDGKVCLAGSRAFLEENGIETGDDNPGYTAINVACDGKYVGSLYLSDTVKEDSVAAIAALKRLKIKTVMLTGDNPSAAQKIFDVVQTDEYVAGVLPEDKERYVRGFQEAGYSVAMVGDGINDAPALTRADVGIAIGAGTDIAVDSADVVLIRNSLTDVVRAIELSKQTMRVIKQNLFWAFGYNTLGIPIAAGVFYPLFNWLLNPMIAAACMSLSSISVVLNALRLRLIKDKEKKETMNNIKTIKIKGMSCEHCVSRVKDGLLTVGGVTGAEVNLRKKTAVVTLGTEVSDEALREAVERAGYTVTDVK